MSKIKITNIQFKIRAFEIFGIIITTRKNIENFVDLEVKYEKGKNKYILSNSTLTI